VVALYNQAQPMFAGSGRRVQAVSLSERGSWSLRLREGVEVVVGRHDVESRLRRFAHLLPQIVAARPNDTLLRADLRYTNGFTLTWRNAPTSAPAGTRPSRASNSAPSAPAPITSVSTDPARQQAQP
jgi:cell division protein FtsQ